MSEVFRWAWEGALSGLWKAIFLALLAGGSVSQLFGGVRKAWRWFRAPRFEILGKVRVSSNNYYRITVRNNSRKTLKIGAKLVSVEPATEKATGNFPLQLTGHAGESTADIPKHTTQQFDVFRALGVDDGLVQLQGVNSFPEIPKAASRFKIAAYEPGGASVERTFELDPTLRVVGFEAVDE